MIHNGDKTLIKIHNLDLIWDVVKSPYLVWFMVKFFLGCEHLVLGFLVFADVYDGRHGALALLVSVAPHPVEVVQTMTWNRE